MAKPRRGCWPPRRVMRPWPNRALRRYMRRCPSLEFIETSTMDYTIEPGWSTDICLGDVLNSLRKGA